MSRRLVVALVVCLWPLMAAAQSPGQVPAARSARLAVTVLDPSNAVIPNATVTVIGTESATEATVAPVVPIKTSGAGVAAFDAIAPGKYTIRAEFPGFETIEVRDFRVKAGENKRAIVLPLQKQTASVTVARDKRDDALDPKGNAFSTVLTREQIAALPDDPDEMEAALKAMAPPGSSIRVDGFSGGKLPPKSQIRSIRLPKMDMLAAQNHGGINGMLFIDIGTQPGMGPLAGSADFTLRDSALNARNPFTPVEGDEGLRQFGGSLSGTLVQNKTSFSLSGQGGRQWTSNNLLAAVPGTTLASAVRQPTDQSNFSGLLTSAINKDHTARFSFARTAADRSNLGVGGYNLPGRAYEQNASDNTLRLSESGPLGKRFFTESRLQVHWNSTSLQSAYELPAIVVLDAFTSGGAQQTGDRRVRDFEAATDLDYVRGRHSLRTGALFEGGDYRTNQTSNYLGTYTFTSLEAYDAGTPASFTRRIGDPSIRYTNLQAGVYVQDDWRAARALMVSPGIRYEAQNLISDQNNVSPRVSVTYSPYKSGKTTFRGGYGFFNDWLGVTTYEQTLQVDGERQKEVNILNPSYPDPGVGGTAPPTNKYLLGSGIALPQSLTANVGIDRQITPTFRVNATYTYRRGMQLLRGSNTNAPVNSSGGVRPDPSFSNIVEVRSDAGMHVQSINVGANFIALNWHRTFFVSNYNYARAESNTSGAFSLPANGDDLGAEWGPSAVRHRFASSVNTSPIANLSVALNFRAQSGTPYTITTGLDSNGDGVFNDRPAGVGRNSAWTQGQWDLGARVSYAMGFGTRAQAGGAGGGQTMVVRMGGGDMAGGFGGGAAGKRYRVECYVAVQNVTNHNNYISVSGVQTSPFFGLPTNVLNPRKAEIGLRFGF
jgi:hypothetical protein